jgi:hypothetical protein
MPIKLGWHAFDPQRPTVFRYSLQVEPEDIRSLHVMGQPGYGKSTLLGHLAEQFVAAGEGVLLLDFKGELARNVASRTRHPDRLIYVDPFEAARHGHYWALNPMGFDRSEVGAFEFYADALPELFANIGLYDPAQMARIERYLTGGVKLALSQPGTTLLDVYLVLHDEPHRERLLQSRHLDPLPSRRQHGPARTPS